MTPDFLITPSPTIVDSKSFLSLKIAEAVINVEPIFTLSSEENMALSAPNDPDNAPTYRLLNEPISASLDAVTVALYPRLDPDISAGVYLVIIASRVLCEPVGS